MPATLIEPAAAGDGKAVSAAPGGMTAQDPVSEGLSTTMTPQTEAAADGKGKAAGLHPGAMAAQDSAREVHMTPAAQTEAAAAAAAAGRTVATGVSRGAMAAKVPAPQDLEPVIG